MITFQLLSKDGSSLDDAEMLSGRWQGYVEGFVSDAETPGVPTSKVRRPFLRRFVITHPNHHFLSIYVQILTIPQQVVTRLCRDYDRSGTRSGYGHGTRFLRAWRT
jgi:histone deacetylase complex regulatory component SIN3